MLDNYTRLDNGVVKQINYQKKDIMRYNTEYVNERYNQYGEKVMQMSFLRLGYLLSNIKSYNSIVDVGYGNGSFLNASSLKFKNCYGCDVSGYPLPNNCEEIDFNSLMNKEFDVVTFFDSLEHFEDITFVKDIQCKYIYISVPWCHYYSDEWFKDWKHRRENEHLWHFNKESLTNFFEENNYECVCVSNIEDTIRQHNYEYENILTGIFKKHG
jgi:hypothetical protein